MGKTNFKPQKHAFKFGNRFRNEVRVFGSDKIPIIGKYLKMETNGLCGGMAFSALDYYYSDRPTPTVVSANSQLRKYLLKRQLDSFKYRDSWRFFRWTRKSSRDIASKTLKNEIPKVKKSIDRGKPVVIGLVGATKLADIGNENHQVICYGYDINSSGGTELCIYDPNCPPDDNFSGELLLFPFTRKNPIAGTDVPGDSAEPIKTITSGYPAFKLKRSVAGKGDKIWRGFFVQRYSRRSNPPIMRDTARDERGRLRRDDRKRRDHRSQDNEPKVRDHRTRKASGSRSGNKPRVRDHRKQK